MDDQKGEMTMIISFRAAPDLELLIDRYMGKINDSDKGMKVSRAVAIRVLLYKGLAAEGLTP
ncbi:MAG: hypothetical protein E4H01_08095 [Lysobacterales bacterium]|nr:MAG: hypothetical protein E4H01_08095 [Xanthomonadales bacterium]